MLTGESVPELASTEPDPRTPPSPTAGRSRTPARASSAAAAKASWSRPGSTTEFGRIARGLAERERRRSPLQRELDRLVRILLVVAIGLIGVTVGLGFVRGNPLGENVLAGISAAIAAIPEEPPVLLAVILGLGAYRLLRRGVLVRRLNAEETLGAVDLIMTDKTGTLTAEPPRGPRRARRPIGPDRRPRSRATTSLAMALRAEEDAWHVGAGARPGSFTQALAGRRDGAPAASATTTADLVGGEPPSDGRPYSTTWAPWQGRR